MSSSHDIYAKGYVAINGANSLEATSITISHASNSTPVSSITKGKCGVTPGSGECTFQMSFNVPAKGFEFNFTEVLDSNTPVNFEFRYGAMVCILDKADVATHEISYADGGNATLNISGTSAYKKFQAG